MTIAKICDILAWQNQQLGFMDNNGFKVPVEMQENLQSECLTFTAEELDAIDIDE